MAWSGPGITRPKYQHRQNANSVLLIIYVTTLLVGSMCSDILVGLILTRILYCGWIAPGIQDGDVSGLPVLIGSPRA